MGTIVQVGTKEPGSGIADQLVSCNPRRAMQFSGQFSDRNANLCCAESGAFSP